MTDMQAPRWTSKARGLALVCAVLGAATAPAAAEDDSPGATMFRYVLKGLGLRQDTPDINYRERSPLVVPPGITLPPPDSRPPAERNANWPVDQDERRSREAAAARAELGFQDPYFQARPLSREELDKGRARGARNGGSKDPYIGQTLTPSELGYIGGLFDSMLGRNREEYKPFTGEPPRAALVEPPPGYQTPSPAQPYGIGRQKGDTKTYNPLTMQYE